MAKVEHTQTSEVPKPRARTDAGAMKVSEDTKLDFRDVLIRPRRSTLRSRSEVSLDCTYTFKHSGQARARASTISVLSLDQRSRPSQVWKGVPVIAANMDTTGTFEMAEALASKGAITALHKHYTIDEWRTWLATDAAASAAPFVAVSSGSSEADLAKLQTLLELDERLRFICLDVANGYSEAFVQCVRAVRAAHPKHTLMAGNVVTMEMTEELLLSGADIVKVSCRVDHPMHPQDCGSGRAMATTAHAHRGWGWKGGDHAHTMRARLITPACRRWASAQARCARRV